MIETELALALSARDWSDHLRRFIADHGGARVRVTALGPDDLVDESFDVLVIDDICSFLTPHLVEVVKASGRAVIGVHDPEEFSDGSERLFECGVTDVIPAGALPEEFLEVIGRVADLTAPIERESTPHRSTPSDATRAEAGRVIVVAGPGGGTGVTEVAIALADAMRRSGRAVALVDGDDEAAAMAQRLGLGMHPNVRTAIDVIEQRSAGVLTTLQDRSGIPVMVGMPGVDGWAGIRPRQLIGVVDELIAGFEHVIVDAGNRPGAWLAESGMVRALVDRADVGVCVAAPSPVGVARLLGWLSEARGSSTTRWGVVVNRAPRNPYRRGEITEEIARNYVPPFLEFLPEDAAVGAAAWDGTVVPRSRFRRSVDESAVRLLPAVARS